MTIEELQSIIDSTEWTFLKKGAYNSVSVSLKKLTINGFAGQWVLKIPLCKNALSDSTRAVRKWNDLNPVYPAFKTEKGWIAPYLGNAPASDEQIANKLIDIYRRTGNIIFDAYVDGNFLFYNGEVICIDVDQSLRRGSIASDDWRYKNSPAFRQHFKKKLTPERKQRIAVIETLLYLEENLPQRDIKIEYITLGVISKLSIFCHEKEPLTVEIMDTLLKIVAADPTNEIKDQYFTPQFVETLRSSQEIITKDSLARLINDQLLERARPSDIIRMGNLDDVRILINHNRELLYQLDKEGLTLLHIAAMNGYTEIARYLLGEGAHVDTVTSTNDSSDINSNMTALDLAICDGMDTTANLLLEAGATISPVVCDKFKYLCFFARNGLLERVKLFIEQDPELIHTKDNFNQTALLLAACEGQHEIVEFLINQGADVTVATQFPSNYKYQSNWSPLDWAIKGGHIFTVSTLIISGAVANHVHSTVKDKALEQLIREGDLDAVQVLISHNEALLNQIDNNGYAPLHYAVFYEEIEITQYLIAAGADLDKVTLSTERTLYPNMTAMDIVLSLKKYDTVAMLFLEAGAGVSPAVDGKYHAIHLAAKNGKFNLVKTLIERNRELIHVRDSMNQTPLLWAAAKGYNEIVEFLIEQSAEVNIATQTPVTYPKHQEENNRSPLDWAIKGGHTDTALTLIKAGAVANICTDDSINQITKNLVKLSIFQSTLPSIKYQMEDENTIRSGINSSVNL